MELVIESCLQVFLDSEHSQDLNWAWHVFYLMAFIFISITDIRYVTKTLMGYLDIFSFKE